MTNTTQALKDLITQRKLTIDPEWISIAEHALTLATSNPSLTMAQALIEGRELMINNNITQRRQKKEAAIALMITNGLTPEEANKVFGIGTWWNEVSWSTIKKILITHPHEVANLVAGLQCNSDQTGHRTVGHLFGPNHPRAKYRAWSNYALQLFNPTALLKAKERDKRNQPRPQFSGFSLGDSL